MQRLARFKLAEINQNATVLFSHYDDIRQILLKHLPPSTASLFARPEIKSDNQIVEWYSELEGQPVLLGQSEANQTKFNALQPLINERLSAIEKLNQSLSQQGRITPDQSAWLTQLVEGASHDTKQIFVVNNEPVITGWGLGKKVAPPPPPAPPVVPVAGSKHRWCCWLLPLLLLLLLGSLACWWFNRPVEPISEPPKVVEPASAEPKAEEPKIEEPTASESQPEIPIEEPKIEEPQIVEPELEIPQPEAQDMPQQEEIKPAPTLPQKVCRPKYKKGETPQMVLVFDDSSSMQWTLLESPQTIAAVQARWLQVGVSPAKEAYMSRLPNRLSVAKKSSRNIIDSIAKDVDIGFVALRECPSATSYGFYSAQKRKALKAKISSMKGEGATPLYSGLQKAASMVNGVTRDAFILLLSDGEDSCTQENICSLAQKIAAQKPRLKINVVDIGGAKAANCVARATGGKVFTALNQKEVVHMINQAVKPMQEQEVCE